MRRQRARGVGVDLDAEAIRIGEIERLADQVIAGAGVNPDVGEMLDEAAQRRPVREQDRKWKSPSRPRPAGRQHSAPLAELDEGTGTGAEHGDGLLPRELGQAESVAVEIERALEVGDLERDGPDRRRRRQAKAARRFAVTAGCRRLDGRQSTEDVAGRHAQGRLLATTVRQPGRSNEIRFAPAASRSSSLFCAHRLNGWCRAGSVSLGWSRLSVGSLDSSRACPIGSAQGNCSERGSAGAKTPAHCRCHSVRAELFPPPAWRRMA